MHGPVWILTTLWSSSGYRYSVQTVCWAPEPQPMNREELDSWVQCWPRSVGAWRWYSVSGSFLNRSSVRALEVDAQLEFSIFISPSCSSRLIDFYAFLIFKASTGDIIRFCCCRDHGHYWYLLVDCLSVSWDLCHVLTGLLWAVESSIVFVLEDELI